MIHLGVCCVNHIDVFQLPLVHKSPLKLHFEELGGQRRHFESVFGVKHNRGENLVGRGKKSKSKWHTLNKKKMSKITDNEEKR